MKLQINIGTSTIILYLMTWKRFFDSARLVNFRSLMKHSDEPWNALISEQFGQFSIFEMPVLSPVRSEMCKVFIGVYYIALFLGVTYSQIVLYIFQSFLIDFRFISCFAKPFLMINHWMDDGYACITLCDLRLVGINWRHFIPPFVKKNTLQVEVVLPIPSRLLVSRRPF